MKAWRRVIRIVLGAILVVAMVSPVYADTVEQRLSRLEAQVANLEKALALSALDVPKLVTNAMPGVVSIYNVTDKDEVDAWGTGWVLTSDGVIATNAHLINLDYKQKVKFADGTAQEAEVILWDTWADVAELKVPGSGYSALPIAKSKPQTGEPLVVIGNALGLSNSVTVGVVSGVDRPDPDHFYHYPSLQTDAAINPGNSGGPMLNARGEVVAIAAWRAVNGAQAVGFGVPVDRLADSVSRIVQNHGIVRPWLGISADEPYWSRGMLPNSYGLWITKVHPNGAAAAAGLKPGDYIMAVGGVKVNYLSELRTELEKHKPGDRVVLTVDVNRPGELKWDTREITVTPGEMSGAVDMLVPAHYDYGDGDLF